MGRVRILAADSMGVRSLATVVEAGGLVVGLDLGASLAPRRYGLPPHEVELERLKRALEEAERWVRESNVVVVTHYHYDHYMRDRIEAYHGRILLVKHPKRDINRSQAIRSYRFLRSSGLEERARVEYADSRSFEFEGVRIEFSSPVWHGAPGSRVGKVVMVRILSEDIHVVFTSDVQGPGDPEALRVLESWSKPRIDVLILGGPPTYFAGYKVPVRDVEAGLEGMLAVVERVRPRVLVYDHHLLRDARYRERIHSHLKAAERLGVRMVTAAEFMGRPVEQLEAMRRELWGVGSGSSS